MAKTIQEINEKITRYVATKVSASAVTGFLCWITYAISGLDLALMFGVVCFLLNFIPSVS